MEYVHYNNKMFVVKRKIKEHSIKPNRDMEPLKILWHCDTILKKDHRLRIYIHIYIMYQV